MSNPKPSSPETPSAALPRRRGDSCPVCGKPASAAHAPFCGQGCRDRDLLQWLGEGYRVPGPAVDAGDED